MDDQELLRYSRHLLLNELGPDAQARFSAARALVVGAGGLGNPAAQFLASSGVGRITLVDADAVDLRSTDLHRTLIRTDPLRLVTSRRRTVRSLADCADDRWVLGGLHSRHGAAARRVCRAAGFEPNVIVETEDHHIAFQVVRAAGAVTLLPDLALVDVPKGVAVARAVDVGHVRRVELVTRTTLHTNPAVTRLRDALTES